MSARQKLNAAYFTGSTLIAGVLGVCFDSWGVFCVALLVFLVGSLHSGDIRPQGREGRR